MIKLFVSYLEKSIVSYTSRIYYKKGSLLTNNFKFTYDIDQGNLEIPNDFNQNIKNIQVLRKIFGD